MKNTRQIKMIVDILMTVGLIVVMAYQVTGNLYHEITGSVMLVLFIAHHVLNRKWYGSLLKGRYSPTRIVWTLINLLVTLTILLTGLSGIAMSKDIFAFLNIRTGMDYAREIHLACSHCSYVLMGCHLGFHWSMVTGALVKKTKQNRIVGAVLWIVGFLIAVYGAVRVYQTDIYSYMFLRNLFAFLDYEKAAPLVFFDNMCRMGCFVWISYHLKHALDLLNSKKNTESAVHGLLAVLVFMLTITAIPGVKRDNEMDSWSTGSTTPAQTAEVTTAEPFVTSDSSHGAVIQEVQRRRLQDRLGTI